MRLVAVGAGAVAVEMAVGTPVSVEVGAVVFGAIGDIGAEPVGTASAGVVAPGDAVGVDEQPRYENAMNAIDRDWVRTARAYIEKPPVRLLVNATR